ncbi:AraC family transcriptional regulator [Fibrella sp. HMF5036]|uniref:AraC family transcriptional regulator n=2 Tax=Fibrella aquatilis TaxID=2817059 RepID=A0A939JX33_9BACT|nr:AraC family transcriptional regulator [Fibrella aquatilis]
MNKAADDTFPAISPAMARERFLVKDELWESRFRPNFNQFIIASFEFARPVIKLPMPAGRTGNHAVFLLTGGQVELTIGHQAYSVGAQELVVIPALQIFSLHTIREDTTGFLCFFSNETLRGTTSEANFDFLRLTSHPITALSDQQTSFLAQLLARLLVEYTESGASRTDIIHPYLLALLAEINRQYASQTPAKTDVGDRLVQGFMSLLNENSRQKSQVADYANLLNISPNHLNKVIRARTGKSPSRWIDERRVLEAKVLLYQSALSIGQIAAELGFTDQTSFGKLFRRYAQVSPSAFRKMIDAD